MINEADINRVDILALLEHLLGVCPVVNGIAGSADRSISSYLRNYQIYFQSGFTSLQ